MTRSSWMIDIFSSELGNKDCLHVSAAVSSSCLKDGLADDINTACLVV
jgi:hypothetical protein